MSKRRLGSGLAFNDLLFNVLIGFVMLFIIAFLLINPITKKADIPVKAEFIITIEWEDESSDDIDLWMQRDNGPPVGFSRKEGAPLHLDRDDLGSVNDTVLIDGRATFIKVNRETMTIRGIVPGDYYIAAHYYSKRKGQVDPLNVTITVIKVNPFQQVYSITKQMMNVRTIEKWPGISIDSDGKITNIFNHNRKVAPMGGRAP
jgi:hypothetical protein